MAFEPIWVRPDESGLPPEHRSPSRHVERAPLRTLANFAAHPFGRYDVGSEKLESLGDYEERLSSPMLGG